MEKYGFVYIWRDRKRRMFYIGSHWGTKDDGYICSSNRMREAHRRRPFDFKRRLIKIVYDRSDLLKEEQYWLSKVKDKKKYYNLNFDVLNPWWHDLERNKTVRQKLIDNHWSKNNEISIEIRKKISESKMGRAPPNKGVAWTDEQREKYTKALKGHKKPDRTLEHKQKIAENSTRLQEQKRIGMHGKSHTEKTKQLMSKNNAMNNPVCVQKIKAAKKNIKWLVNINTGNRKMASPDTDKWRKLISNGYVPIS